MYLNSGISELLDLLVGAECSVQFNSKGEIVFYDDATEDDIPFHSVASLEAYLKQRRDFYKVHNELLEIRP